MIEKITLEGVEPRNWQRINNRAPINKIVPYWVSQRGTKIHTPRYGGIDRKGKIHLMWWCGNFPSSTPYPYSPICFPCHTRCRDCAAKSGII